MNKAVLTPVGLGWAGDDGCTSPPLDRQWCIVGLDEDAEVGTGMRADTLRGFVQDIRIQPALAAVEVSLVASDTGMPTAIEAVAPLCPEFRVVRFCGATPGESERYMVESFQGKSEIARRARQEDRTGFADCCPLHVLSLESLADLRRRLPQHATGTADSKRFRPNIIVSGCRAPYVEDGWHRVRLGGAVLRQLDSTGRCEIPTTSPSTGKRSEDSEPRTTLLSYRPIPHGAGPHGGPTFGVWMATDGIAKQHPDRSQEGFAIVSINDTLHPVGPMGRL